MTTLAKLNYYNLHEYTPDEEVSETNASDGRNIGVAKVMNLMQGDVIDFDTRYYYEEYTPVQTQAPVYSILSQLANIFIFNATSIAGVPFQSEAEQIEWANYTFLQNPEVNNFLIEQFEDTNKVIEAPYAYLTWLYFTEKFEFVPEASGMLLAENPEVLGEMGVEGLEMPLDGFLYIYVNNESAHDVQFDNLRIRYNPGQLLQVNHYYPYGLPIKELSTQPSKGKPYNEYLMTTKEWNTEFGLNEYDFGARSYDPAIARWYVQDPAGQFYNPYLAIGNNPVILYDPDGRIVPFIIAGAIIGAYVGGSMANNWQMNPAKWDYKSNSTWIGIIAGGAIGAAGGYMIGNGASLMLGWEGAELINITAVKGFNITAGSTIAGTFGVEAIGNINWSSVDALRANQQYEEFMASASLLASNGSSFTPFQEDAKSGYVLRDKNVNWLQLYIEFMEGTGPERSLFIQGHPMIEDLRGGYIEKTGREEFAKLNGEALLNYDVKFGPWNGRNMTEQFIGGARISVLPYGADKLAFIVNNTTDKYSYYYHLGESIARVRGHRIRQSTIYQRFIWIGPR